MSLRWILTGWWRRDGDRHSDIGRRLDAQERRVERFDRRITRVEIELGILHPGVDEVDDAGGSG